MGSCRFGQLYSCENILPLCSFHNKFSDVDFLLGVFKIIVQKATNCVLAGCIELDSRRPWNTQSLRTASVKGAFRSIIMAYFVDEEFQNRKYQAIL